MIADFALPDLGEGLPEAELVQWLVSEGDSVALNQTIAEVETAKAVVELPSPHAGVIRALHAAAGDVIAVGAVLVSFDVDGEDARPATTTAEKAQPNLVGYGAAPRAEGRPHRRARVAASTGSLVSEAAVREAAPHDAIRVDEAPDRPAERPRSTPPVRRLAKDLGVDLALVDPVHPERLLTREDVEEYARRITTAPHTPASQTDDRTTRIPIHGVRKRTAEAMVRSAFTAPTATTFVTVDVTATMELISSLATERASARRKIGVLAVAAKAVCLALARHPSLNARWDEEHAEIVEHHFVNLGIAVATERGLIVPNIRDADAMPLDDLADAIATLADIARAGKTAPAAMREGTFSITNVGVFGVDAGTPILNPGEAAILALGAVRRRPWEHQGEIALRDVTTLALSFDHRLVDGEQGSRFLVDVADILREPGRAMLLR